MYVLSYYIPLFRIYAMLKYWLPTADPTHFYAELTTKVLGQFSIEQCALHV